MLFKRIVTLFFTFIILFADCGQTIYAHTCQQSKETSLSIGTLNSCCEEIHADYECCVKKSSCCSISEKYLKQPIPPYEIKLSFDSFIKATIIETDWFTFPVLCALEKRISTFLLSPPLCKHDIRFTQVFRI